MTIAAGDKLPNVTFKVMTDAGPADKTTAEVFAGKRVALFAVPGAYTPTCSRSHLPGFVDAFDALKAKGVDTIACTAVNDVFVLSAWGGTCGANSKVLFLADGSGNFAKALGLELDLVGGGLGVRSKRYSMLVEDGVVKTLHVEEESGKAIVSTAEALLADL
jgi:glutaredoxin/glutathione-dependent peroxiredoxin